MIAPDIIALTARCAPAECTSPSKRGTVFTPVSCDLMSIVQAGQLDAGRSTLELAHERLRIQPQVLAELIARYEYQLKFVIERPGDLDEVRSLVGLLGADREHVILMPEGTDAERLRERSQWLAEICKSEGYRFSPRLHVDLWGNRRGV